MNIRKYLTEALKSLVSCPNASSQLSEDGSRNTVKLDIVRFLRTCNFLNYLLTEN